MRSSNDRRRRIARIPRMIAQALQVEPTTTLNWPLYSFWRHSQGCAPRDGSPISETTHETHHARAYRRGAG